jgi:hypothetical protein
MKKLFILTILLAATSFLLKAQDVIKPKAQPDSIIKIIPFGEGRSADYLYTIGDKLQTRQDVILRLQAYAPSAFEYHAAKNNFAWVYVSFAGAAVTGIAATIDFAKNNKMAGETTGFVNGQPAFIYQHHSLTGAYVLTGAATAFLFSSFINLARGAFHANNAIRLYNQQYQ